MSARDRASARTDFETTLRAMRVFRGHRVAGTALLRRLCGASPAAFQAAASSFARSTEHAFGPECVRVAGREGRSRGTALASNLKAARFRRDARLAGRPCSLDSTPGLRLMEARAGL